jgi:hypothetical protein
MKTVIGLPLVPFPLPLEGAIGLDELELHPTAANSADPTRKPAIQPRHEPTALRMSIPRTSSDPGATHMPIAG